MKALNPKVSIVIPVYNGSNYLKEAIDSALAQTYENIEIVVVNDGSNDEGATERIAKSYGKKIKYYNKENGGVATALNLGIKNMTGDYFSWLSHDDMYYQDKIEKQMKFLASHNYKKLFLYSNYSILKDRKITPVIHDHEMLLRKPKYSLLRGCVNGITILLPKSFLDEMGEVNEQLRAAQDYDYWRRIGAKYEFVHMEDVLSITRLHSLQDTNVSPRVMSEGNDLWIDMVKKLSEKEKMEYEGTLYNFYFEMVKFLETTPYKGTLEYCQSEMDKEAEKLKASSFNPKASVVIPFYNRVDKTLVALKSVLNQNHANTEVILVDDGSTGDTSQLIKFIKGHKNITLVSLEHNQGPAAARNKGIHQAAGEYIAFLDSDDEFLGDKLEKQLSMMSKHNLNISYTPYLRREAGQETVVCDTGLTGIVVPRILSGCMIATSAVVVRKQLLIENNIFFDEKMRVGEDTCFWFEIAKYSEILLVNEPLTIVNVDDETHAQNNAQLVVGIKNLITYILNDDYYYQYNHDISLLCRYFSEINNDLDQKELNRLLYEGPVASIKPAISKEEKVATLVKNSIPYGAARKLFRMGLSAVAHWPRGKQ